MRRGYPYGQFLLCSWNVILVTARHALEFDLHLRQQHPGTQRRLSSTGAEVDLANYDNVQYYLKIQVGEPCPASSSQSFYVVPDTGSSDLWIPAQNCTSCTSLVSSVTRTAALFNLTASCSHKEVGDRVHFTYGDGTRASGMALEDTVEIGGIEVRNQYLIQVDTLEELTRMQSDGILGLAHHFMGDSEDGSSFAKGHSFLANLFKQHPEVPHQFSFALTADPVTGEMSKFVVGEPNMPAHSQEDHFHYGKSWYMEKTGLWLTSVWSLGWSGTGIEQQFHDGGRAGMAALVDSGSSLIVLAPDLFDTFVSDHLPKYLSNCEMDADQQVLHCDCPSDREMRRIPSLVINIITQDDEQYPLCMGASEFILRSMDEMAGDMSCVPALQRGDYRQPLPIIIGMTFMRAFYTTFDMDARAIGFARSSQSPLPPDAVCKIEVDEFPGRIVWVLSLMMAVFSVIFMLCVCCSKAPGVDASYAATPSGAAAPLTAQSGLGWV
mmetsp:Transcript_52361/g.125034  ORF Transcript_52361/g.125034 Transcript_52361/m.125034 type:complete len:494 (+) Transcript_52361:56-1537(+)